MSDLVRSDDYLEKENRIKTKLESASYRIATSHVSHITVDVIENEVTALKLEINGAVGQFGSEYHLTTLEEVGEIVGNTPVDRQATMRATDEGIIEEVHLIIHSTDPKQVHYFVSQFCQCIDDKI